MQAKPQPPLKALKPKAITKAKKKQPQKDGLGKYADSLKKRFIGG